MSRTSCPSIDTHRSPTMAGASLLIATGSTQTKLASVLVPTRTSVRVVMDVTATGLIPIPPPSPPLSMRRAPGSLAAAGVNGSMELNETLQALSTLTHCRAADKSTSSCSNDGPRGRTPSPDDLTDGAARASTDITANTQMPHSAKVPTSPTVCRCGLITYKTQR